MKIEVMEDKPCHPNPVDETIGIVRSTRDVPPAHYTYQIESFSLLLEREVEKCESGDFEAGGYKWRLSLYPKGNVRRNGNGHLSLYLAITETDSLPLGWEVNVSFKFFVFDQIRDKYLTIQDADGRIRRFHKIKSEWGFAQLLSLDTFNESSNGYLIDDCCVFGVEVFVIKSTSQGETLSMLSEPENGHYSWKIDKYSALNENFHSSDLFTFKGLKWKLKLYPKGQPSVTRTSLSLYLTWDGFETVPPKRKFYAKYKLQIRDQVNGNHHQRTVDYWFISKDTGYGFHEFLSLSNLLDSSKGYLVNDTLIIECVFIELRMFHH